MNVKAWIWGFCTNPWCWSWKLLELLSQFGWHSSYHQRDLFGPHLLHLFSLFLQLLVLLSLFVLRLPDVTVSENWHIYLNCSLLLLVNHSQHLLADSQLTSQVGSMALYALGVVMTGKRPTHESKFQICTLLEEILWSFT